MKPSQAEPYVRLVACLAFLDVSELGLRKIAGMHALLEEAYPKHVRYFLQKHASEIPGLTEDLLLYKSRNQPWPGSSIMEFYHDTKDLIDNHYNPEFLALCNADGSLPPGRSLEELRMATKEQLWNKHQLELVAKNMQAAPSEPLPQTPDPLEAQESLESPELLAEQKKNGSGRSKQTSVIPFDVTNPVHRDWTPLGWIAWLHLGLGSPEPHDNFSLKPSGGDVPPVQNQMKPDFHQRMSRSRSEQRRRLREKNRRTQEELGRRATDLPAPDSLSNVVMAAGDRLMCQYRQSQERTQRINNLQLLMQLTDPGSSEHAQAKAELLQLLKSTAEHDNLPSVAPDFHQRMSRSRSEQRQGLREKYRRTQEELGRRATDLPAPDSLSNVVTAAVDRLMCQYRQSQERTQRIRERNQMIRERTQRINNLQLLMQLTDSGSSEHAQAKAELVQQHAQAKAELVQLLKSTAEHDNLPSVAQWECASGTPGPSSMLPGSVTNSRNMGIASPASSVVATPVSLSDQRIFTNDALGTTENCSPQSRVRARPMDLDRLFKKTRTNNVEKVTTAISHIDGHNCPV
ncbi:hypothetical protein GUITHDRAFT_110473 [Guillardia theta CCMP2712]|uniref:Uncharacterized protein n=1 Tax=Guillardia theta (strain CCMP2712) TaxID=905079 RepID=L1J6E2_GUITC|nr:hypothetical protein GUITHDRAFT_110473 [Guillardia theta CCMP2712]EKX43674.1 hypothetical protein GUITHDRAFT_110473 [Guillardia theta CCMP2712]|eukprot:XP_005830654.1 hypothetical protein GUITHDRAFT_110473 [Guillardia theta CCMP2712]